MGNRLLLKKKKNFLNFLMRFTSIKVNRKYHNTLPPTLTFDLFNQLLFKNTFQYTYQSTEL